MSDNVNVCVIDIGSNTVKASIFEIDSDGKKKSVDFCGHKIKLVSMIEEVNGNPVLSDHGIDALCDSVQQLLTFADNNKCSTVHAFATAIMRKVSNAAKITAMLEESFSLSVDVLSGEEEALCSLRGLLSEEGMEGVREGIMVDMGGGSTEIVHFMNGSSPAVISLNFGCVSLQQEFLHGNVPTDEEIALIESYVLNELQKCQYVKSLQIPLYLIGGSARAISKIINGDSGKLSLRHDGSDFTTVLNKFRLKNFLQEAENIIPGRIQTVCPAAIAYRTIARFAEASSITVSESGVREGYLEKILP